MTLRTNAACCALALLTVSSLTVSSLARAQRSPRAGSVLRAFGEHAERTLAPTSRTIGAMVALPPGVSAESLGLVPFAPGLARLRGSAASLIQFSDLHPDLRVEVAPTLHTLLDKAGLWVKADLGRFTAGVDGTGTLVGVADTGLDVTHPDLLDENGKSRVAWVLDLSLKPLGYHPDLEARFGATDATGKVVTGAVLTGAEIDELVAAKLGSLPGDEVGHGTHVAAIAASNGGTNPHTGYTGMAPGAKLVIARVTRTAADGIENDDLVRGVAFIFDRADAEKKPVSVNLSLGSDFGPHDGTMLWENALASFVGPGKPGHALVVAAGNSGSIAELAVHQSVHVARGSTVRVPVSAPASKTGSVQLWVAMRAGASLDVGLDGPDGTWISPVSDGHDAGKNGSGYNAGVLNGASSPGAQGQIPAGSHGAIIVWSGAWPGGQYNVVLQGAGTADLYVQGDGDAASASFVAGVREGTINLPATHPSILSVGCTVNRPTWISIDKAQVALHEPRLDSVGGSPLRGESSLIDGEVCWFSSAGPTVTGVPKPEISAPGGLVIAAMSRQALPGGATSIFTNPSCPPLQPGGKPDPRCLQIDDRHGVAVGTSMSAPFVAGAAALLFQQDPTLTQDQIVTLLQAGAHPFRGPAPFEDQGGPGELDVNGALDALARMRDPRTLLPSLERSWVTLSSDYAPADGSTAVTAILELRTQDGHRADLLGDRLRAAVRLDGEELASPPLVRKGPGLYTFAVLPPTGTGGSSLAIGATFDGVDIVPPKTLPIATDIWASEYSASTKGGCATSPARAPGTLALAGVLLALAGLVRRRR